jgi:hypothetical protein
MFAVQQIGFSALMGAIVSGVCLWLAARYWRRTPFELPGALGLSLLVGLSILFFRLAANVQPLNDDPIPLASPNDVLCPGVTYVVLSVYAGLRGTRDQTQFSRDRALLTVVSLAVNIVTI